MPSRKDSFGASDASAIVVPPELTGCWLLQLIVGAFCPFGQKVFAAKKSGAA
jgi:hypothetical protein